jgi:hypothetical protein
LFFLPTLAVGDSTTEAVEVDEACGRALRGTDRGGFAGAAKIADGVVVVALSDAGKLEGFVLRWKSSGRRLLSLPPADLPGFNAPDQQLC